jgi:hypothetical protein
LFLPLDRLLERLDPLKVVHSEVADVTVGDGSRSGQMRGPTPELL